MPRRPSQSSVAEATEPPGEGGPLDAAIEGSAQALGATIGSAVGMIAAPEMTWVGAGAGAILGTSLLRAGRGLRRFMSRRGELRAVTALGVATEVIQARLSNGEVPRSDGFFESTSGGRPAGEELAEAMLRAAERSYEEKKVPYIGRLYAHLCFDRTISQSEANHLLRLADALSYRQFLLLQMFALDEPAPAGHEPVEGTEVPIEVNHLLSEAYDLYLRGLLQNDHLITVRPFDLQPSCLRTRGIGVQLVWAMGLEVVGEAAELNHLQRVLAEHEVRAFRS